MALPLHSYSVDLIYVSTPYQECGEFAHCRPWDSNILLSPNVVFGGEVRLPDAIVFLHTKEVQSTVRLGTWCSSGTTQCDTAK